MSRRGIREAGPRRAISEESVKRDPVGAITRTCQLTRWLKADNNLSRQAPLVISSRKLDISIESVLSQTASGSQTDVHKRIAGHGVSRKGQLPAGPVREAAGEGVLAVTDQACLELRHTVEQNGWVTATETPRDAALDRLPTLCRSLCLSASWMNVCVLCWGASASSHMILLGMKLRGKADVITGAKVDLGFTGLSKLCVLKVAEDLLTVVVVLIEPSHDLDRSEQVDGTELFSWSCLETDRDGNSETEALGRSWIKTTV